MSTWFDAIDQDTAASKPIDYWKGVDAVLVDIFDDHAPGEVGTDLYSGINVIERVARLPVRSIAVTPSCSHPLVQLRLHQAHPDFCYHRYQVASIDELTEALRFPDKHHRLPDPDPAEIMSMGARTLLANDAVRAYVGSSLYGRLTSDTGLKELKAAGVSRRTVGRFKDAIVRHGYKSWEAQPVAALDDDGAVGPPRWPAVRDLVLTLLGRLDAPWSEFDRPWWRES